MNDLCTDISYRSLNKYGEELCGDHVNVVCQDEGCTVLVLADGLGSGVKASILSTLTSKIISTMAAEGLSIEECISTIASTLPVCSIRNIAYSTFTVIRISDSREAEIIQYDSPGVIFLRDGRNLELPVTVTNIQGKTIHRCKTDLKENDTFIAVSDGAVYAGTGKTLNFGWQLSDIGRFAETHSASAGTANEMTSKLLDECNELYGGEPGDDTTVCTLRIRKREPVSLLIGPPSNRDDCDKMMSLFFSKKGRHIVCGGTTSTLAASFLKKPLLPRLEYYDAGIPPTADIEGVDLVTEGVITINKVLSNARDFLSDNGSFTDWKYKKDGASRITRLLFEEATDINFFVGRAINPAHQNPELPISFNIKMRLIDELADCLKRIGKRIKVSYF